MPFQNSQKKEGGRGGGGVGGGGERNCLHLRIVVNCFSSRFS